MPPEARQKPLILHTEASPGWGGQEIRTYRESIWFRDQGYDIHLLAPAESEIVSRFRAENFPVTTMDFRKSGQLGDLVRCHRLFRRLRPLAVSTHSNVDTRVALLAASLAGVEHRFRYRHVSIPVRSNLWNRIIYRKLATRIITTAETIAQPLRENFDLSEDRVQTIYTGIDLPTDLPSREKARIDLTERLHLPPETRFIGQVSVLRRWKGHCDVMTAFDEIAAEFPQYHLVFVGGGHGERYLPPFAQNLDCRDRIHFLGHQENPWPLFRALDAATLASTGGEGVPQAGVQAMLAETPFIGTRIGGIPEIIEDRVTGLLIEANRPDQLAAALRTILAPEIDLTKLTTNARDWAVTHASQEKMGQRIRALLTQAEPSAS